MNKPGAIAAILTQCGIILADPARWTQHTLARDQFGEEISPISFKAVKFSAQGVICRALHWDVESDEEDDWQTINTAAACLATIDLMACRLYKRTSVYVNDVLGHEAVLNIYRSAVRYG